MAQDTDILNHALYASIVFAEEPVWCAGNQSLFPTKQVYQGVNTKDLRCCSPQSFLPIKSGKSFESCPRVHSSIFCWRLCSGSTPWVRPTTPYPKVWKTWSARRGCWLSNPLSRTSLLSIFIKRGTQSKSRSSCLMGITSRCPPVPKGTMKSIPFTSLPSSFS